MSTKPLFADLSAEESSAVSGGVDNIVFPIVPVLPGNNQFGLNTFMMGLGAGLLFGNPGLTADEVQYAWEQALYLPVIH